MCLRAAFEKIQAVLTAEQVGQWKKMTGEPYRGQIFDLFGPPR
jgi:hypothetical protein